MDKEKNKAIEAMEERLEKLEEEKSTNMYDVEMRRLDIKEEKRKERKVFYKDHKGKILSYLSALVLVVIFVIFHFRKGLIVAALFLASGLVGGFLDKDKMALVLLNKMFKK